MENYRRKKLDYQEWLLDSLTPYVGKRTCLWLYGKPGTGKSRMAHDVKVDGGIFVKPINKWWDGYK